MPIAQLMALIGIDGNPAEVALNKLKGLLNGLANTIKGTFNFAGDSIKALVSPLTLARSGLDKFMKILFSLTGPLFIFKILNNDIQDLIKFLSSAEINAWRLHAAFGAMAGTLSDWTKMMEEATGISARVFEEGVLRLRSLQANYGITTDQIKLLGIATTDLAQIMGVDAAEGFVRIESAIRGEAEAAERLGLNLQDNYMKGQAFGGALKSLWKDLNESEKAQFRYIEALDQAKFASNAAQESITKGAGGFRVFATSVQEAGNMIWDTLKPAVASVGIVLAGMGNTLESWVKTLTSAFQAGGFSAVFDALPTQIQSIINIVGGLVKPVVENVMGIASVISSYLPQILSVFENVIQTLTPAWTDFWNILGTIVKDFIDEILPYVLDFLVEVAKTFAEAWPVISEIVKAAWAVIKDVIIFSAEYIWPVVKELLVFIRELFAATNSFMAGDTEAGWDHVRKAFLGGAKAIVGILKPALEFVANAFNWLAARLNDFLSWVVSNMPGVGQFLSKQLTEWNRNNEQVLSDGIKELSKKLDGWLDPPKVKKRTKEASDAASKGLIEGFAAWWAKMKEAGARTASEYANGVKGFNTDEAFKKMMEQIQARLKDTPEAAKKAIDELKKYFNEMTEALQMQVFRAETLWDIWKASFKGAEESPEYLAQKLMSLKDKLAALEASLPGFNSLWKEAKTQLGDNSDEAEKLERQILGVKKSIAETSREVETLTDNLIKMTKKDTIKQINDLADAIVSALRNMYEQRKKDEVDAIDNSIKTEEKRHKGAMDNLDKEYKRRKETIEADAKTKSNDKDGAIKGIEREIELLNRAGKDKSELSDIEALKNEIKYELMWGDAKKAAELQKKLDDAEAKRRLRLQIDELNDHKDKLKEEKDAAQEKADNDLKLLQKQYEDKKDAEDKKYELEIQRLQDSKKATEDHYDDLLKASSLHAEATKLIEDKNMQEILKLLHNYGDGWGILGKSYGERLVEGLHESDSLIDGWVQDTFNKLSQILSTEGFNKIIIDKLNAYITDLQSQWLATTDPAKQDALHATADAVRQIIESLGGTPIPAYDKGGAIPTDQLAFVHGGEYMLNRGDVSNISTWLNGLNARDVALGSSGPTFGSLINIEHMEVRDDQDIERVSEQLKTHIDNALRFKG